MSRLSDLGERRILREIIPKFVTAAGDDCASVELTSRQLVITTDPVPQPASRAIAGDDDPYWLGWLLVTINASDLAAAGAVPSGFLAALDLPVDYPVSSFERLLLGISRSCEANSLKYIGGNVRESKEISAVGTAFGCCCGKPLARKGASSGDRLIALGRGGRFWFDVHLVRSGANVDKAHSPLFSPVSQVMHMHRLHEEGLLKCAMDTSDGLAPTLEELALVNGLTIEVDLEAVRASNKSLKDFDRPERLWFGWGIGWLWRVLRHTSFQGLGL